MTTAIQTDLVTVTCTNMVSRPDSEHPIYTGDVARLRVRRVNEYQLALRAAYKALVGQRYCCLANHGGSVANAYKYPAETEACVAMASPDGRVVVSLARLPANKVSMGGVGATAGVRELFDRRYGDEATEACRKGMAKQVDARLVDGEMYLSVSVEPLILAYLADGTDGIRILADYLAEQGNPKADAIRRSKDAASVLEKLI